MLTRQKTKIVTEPTFPDFIDLLDLTCFMSTCSLRHQIKLMGGGDGVDPAVDTVDPRADIVGPPNFCGEGGDIRVVDYFSLKSVLN